MAPILPVSMVPLAARAAGPAGFVLAVVFGLAFYSARHASQPKTPAQPKQ